MGRPQVRSAGMRSVIRALVSFVVSFFRTRAAMQLARIIHEDPTAKPNLPVNSGVLAIGDLDVL